VQLFKIALGNQKMIMRIDLDKFKRDQQWKSCKEQLINYAVLIKNNEYSSIINGFIKKIESLNKPDIKKWKADLVEKLAMRLKIDNY
jgi:gas vesicle protein